MSFVYRPPSRTPGHNLNKSARRKRGINLRVVLILLIAVLIIAGGVFGVWTLLKPQGEIQPLFTLQIPDGVKVYSDASHIIYSYNDRVYCVSADGTALWNNKMDAPLTDFYASGKYVVAWSDSVADVWDLNGREVFKTTPGVIKIVRVCDDAIAIMSADSTGKNNIHLYDLSGK